MITRIRIDNFKRIGSAEIDLGDVTLFIGPNNSGKTTALQALALWDTGWRRWSAKRDDSNAKKRTGASINRRDLYAIPVPSARLLWRNLHTQNTKSKGAGKTSTDKVHITLTVDGVHEDVPWTCALEFYYANEESFYCRLKGDANGIIPNGARAQKVVFLPPMSGLTEREYRKESGEISVLIGEGQTAQVLRNLCWQLFQQEDKAAWKRLTDEIGRLFHIELQDPIYVRERSELLLRYREPAAQIELDLSSSGRGCQQVLLLLSYMLANPGALLLLDEPDAHLEILRQRDVYNLIASIAAETGSQVVAASHSEVVLQEAAERDVVVAFVGSPHRVDTRSRQAQVRKALEKIRMSDYLVAEQRGWMLYVEGSTDLAILARLAERLQHPVRAVLNDSVPVTYLGSNQPQEARDHFYGLREAKPDLVGFALFDRLDKELQQGSALTERMWSRREIENYLVTPESLRAFVVRDLPNDDLVGQAEQATRLAALEAAVAELTHALAITGKGSPWAPDFKVTDDFLDPLFKNYFDRLGTPQRVYKRDYHELADVIPADQIDPEVGRILDALHAVVVNASPAIAAGGTDA
jgi:ABC-type lipoprotein export system ATPase subunit